MTVQAWVWVIGAFVCWVPFVRLANRQVPAPADNPSEMFALILFGALAAVVWPLVLAALAAWTGRGGVERVFLGKPRPSRTDLERRICELEREVEL